LGDLLLAEKEDWLIIRDRSRNYVTGNGTRALKLKVLAPSSSKDDLSFDFPVASALYSRWIGSSTKAVADCVRLFSSEVPSIIYARGPGTAESWAKGYVASVSQPCELVPELHDLIVYLKEAVHPQCSLARCLTCRVAYHHGDLPDFVREEIEDLFCAKAIKVLFCTSTLLEGVNLPADKMFILSPQKGEATLTAFEFRNLIGRAGRLSQHLCGTVYCIQVPDAEQNDWVEPFRADAQKEVKADLDERLANAFSEIHAILRQGIGVLPESDNANLRAAVTILRSHYLRGRENTAKYLSQKAISPEQKEMLLDALESSMDKLPIPASLALKNPFIDPILQDQLYTQVVKAPRDWAIRSSLGFATDLEKVFKQLDSVFHILLEIGKRKWIGKSEVYRSELLTFARLWLHGKPFREIVDRALPREMRKSPNATSDAVDAAIQKAMGLITYDVSFVMAKYFSVLADIIESVVPVDEHAEFSMTLALPGMLELGCSEPTQLALVTACVPRGAALKIAPSIPAGVEDPVVWLSLHQKDQRFRTLPSIYRKILTRVGIWT
jgi:hypothetical protein